MAKEAKRLSAFDLVNKNWEQMVALRKLGMPGKNMYKRRNRLYRDRFVRHYNSLLKTAKLLGMEETTDYMLWKKSLILWMNW